MTTARHNSDSTPRRVLIVEDDADISLALKEAMEMEGFEVSVGANGKEALEQLSRGPAPDVIFLDLMMPVMNGWEFLEARDADQRLSRIPVVVVSAAGDQAKKVPNVRSFVRKPADLDVLIAHATACCEQRA